MYGLRKFESHQSVGCWMTMFTKLLYLLQIFVVLTVVSGCKEKKLEYTPNQRLAILLDAGSSGTKLIVYAWFPNPPKPSDSGVTQLYSEKFKPSLDSFSIKNNVTFIPQYIHDIIDCAKKLIGKDIYKETPVYLFTTAGARFLKGSAALKVIEDVRSTLSNKTINPFIFKRNHARVFSGEEEGAYAWLAANYILGNSRISETKSNLVGVLEMGGGSTQISFLPTNPVFANMYTVRFNKRNYHLYSHSYLMYGQNYMKTRINSYLARRANTQAKSLTNPCMLKGETKQFSFLGRPFEIRGGSDWQQCETIIRYYVRTANKTRCFPKPCAIGHTYQPTVQPTKFYAISAYYYSAKALKAISPDGLLLPGVLSQNAREYCKNSLESNIIQYEVKKKYASDYCLMGLYIPILVTEAYGFSPDTQNIFLAKAVKTKISWALGAVLNKIQYLEPRQRDLPQSA